MALIRNYAIAAPSTVRQRTVRGTRMAIINETSMRKILVTSFSVFAGFAVWAVPARALISPVTGPVIAIFAGGLFLGEVEGNPDGSGTIRIQSRAKPDVICQGQFTTSTGLGAAGNMRCSDGSAATFQFQRLSSLHGYGSGSSSRGSMSFTYGLGAIDAQPYLKLPAGKVLRLIGKDPILADARLPVPANPSATAPIAHAAEPAPDALLAAATLIVTANLRQERTLQTNSPGTIAELVEVTLLPLFNFRHMAQLALASNWRIVSNDQQNVLIAEFGKLLVRTYSMALSNYSDQPIEYRPLRVAPGDAEVTVKSTVKQSGSERLNINYDMEKTAAGWKVYDIKIAGLSLITTYRSTFGRIVRERGVDGLIKALSDGNLRADAGLNPHENDALSVAFMKTIAPGMLRGGR